jgi:small subunit ribosomal protein S6
MASYELVVLLPNQEEAGKIKQIIDENDGKIVKEDFFGEKKLAYQIKKYSQAFYYSYLFSLPEKRSTAKLRKSLNFNDKIIRYLLLVK